MAAMIQNPTSQSPDFRTKILVLFGTRPEVIKLAPVIQQLNVNSTIFNTLVVNSGQHSELLTPFLKLFSIQVDWDLQIMRAGQTPNDVCSRVLASFEEILIRELPDFVLIQGDTTTALAGALAAFHRQIPVGHVEAGLRSHNAQSPFPEEMNRRLITRLATYHFAPTQRNRTNLLNEGVSNENIFVMGNPVVDSLLNVRNNNSISLKMGQLLEASSNLKRLVLTTHRRESFATVLSQNLQVIRKFVERHPDVGLFFPVHPNPVVRTTVQKLLPPHPRIHLLEPLDYVDFIGLLSQAWLILSDSGGIQEEAPTLGKPLLILRENTERPEIIEMGLARLIGNNSHHLESHLEELYLDDSWIKAVRQSTNPFGDGDSSRRIVKVITRLLRRCDTNPEKV